MGPETTDATQAIHHALLGDAVGAATTLGALVLDESGRYVAVNDEACRLCGYARAEIVGSPIGSFNPHLAREYHDRVDAPGSGGTTFIERKDGRRIEIGFRASQTRIGALPFLVVVFWLLG